MSDYLSISEAADRLTLMLKRPVRPRQISKMLYDRMLSEAYCPWIGHQHVISKGYLPKIARLMRSKGRVPSEVSNGA